MDSLLANYASSDDDEEQQHINQPPPPPPPSQHSNPSESLQPQNPPFASSLFSSLPKPQSASSLFTSLPPPKSHLSSTQFTPKSASSSIPTSPNQTGGNEPDEEKGSHKDSNSGSKVSSGLFSSLPAPKSQPDSAPISTTSRPSSASQKRVVQFRPPVIQSSFKSDEKDEDDDDDEYLDKKKSQVINPNSSFKSFISSMPAPMNSATLGMSGTGGSGRRAIVETSVSSLNSDAYKDEKEVGIESYANSSSVQDSSNDGSISGSLSAVEGQLGSGADVADWGQPGESYAEYEAYESYENYKGYASYGNEGSYDQNNWENAPSTWVAPEASVPGIVESVVRGSGKRGRDRIPTEIVEVSQDELMKNRPRQDQAKLTGIAFGPAYQLYVGMWARG